MSDINRAIRSGNDVYLELSFRTTPDGSIVLGDEWFEPRGPLNLDSDSLGDSEIMTLEDTVISYINSFTYLSCQTSTESSASTNLAANLLYSSSSRTQGNFSVYYTRAQADFALDITKYAIQTTAFTDANYAIAYAYLCQHYYEEKFKNWDFTSMSQSGDSVSKPKPTTTGWQNYSALLRKYQQIGQTISTTDLEKHTDYDNYPDEFKDSQLPVIDIPFEDPE